MDFKTVYDILPREVANYVAEYNVEHRDMMAEVLDELYWWHNEIRCDNDICEAICFKDECVSTRLSFSNHEFYFCCDDCMSYGEWSIQYDYLKARRHMVNS